MLMCTRLFQNTGLLKLFLESLQRTVYRFVLPKLNLGQLLPPSTLVCGESHADERPWETEFPNKISCVVTQRARHLLSV